MGVTIKDIAKRADVSIATVSRALSGKNKFNSEKTIKKIQALAKEMGYRKNTAAVELVTRSSKVLAVIVSATKTNFANPIIDGIHEEAYKHGLNVIISYAGEKEPQRQYEAIKTIIERSVKGILLLALDLSESSYKLLSESEIPYIFLSISNNRNIPFIASNDYLIGYQATSYLIGQGHKNIALAGLDTNSYIGKQRIAGYRKALVENKLVLRPEWITNGLFTYDDGLKTMKYFGKNPKITAVVACSDLVGLGIANQAVSLGLHVPTDLSIITIDGTNLCNLVRPTLTSLTQNFHQMGILGTKYLIGNDKDTHYSKFIDVKIEKRKSDCPLARNNKLS